MHADPKLAELALTKRRLLVGVIDALSEEIDLTESQNYAVDYQSACGNDGEPMPGDTRTAAANRRNSDPHMTRGTNAMNERSMT